MRHRDAHHQDCNPRVAPPGGNFGHSLEFLEKEAAAKISAIAHVTIWNSSVLHIFFNDSNHLNVAFCTNTVFEINNKSRGAPPGGVSCTHLLVTDDL